MTFTQEMRRAGRVPSSQVLDRVVRPSTASEAASLGIEAGQPVIHLRRLRLADDQPMALESTVLIEASGEGVMAADLAAGSLHETLARAGIVLRRGRSTIGAEVATAADARLLAVRAGDPLLVERRVIEDGHGRRVEATESRYPADRYGLVVGFDIEGPDQETPEATHDAPEGHGR